MHTQSRTKLDAPEFLLLMVVLFMLWAIGLVDLLAHTTSGADARFFGLYSTLTTAALASHFVLFLVWLALLLTPRSHLLLGRAKAYAQDRAWLAWLVMLVLLGAALNIVTWPDWLSFPGFSTVLLIFLLLMAAIFLFTRWSAGGRWRTVIVSVLALLLLVEGIAQGIAYLGLLPGHHHWDGGYVGYGRIYQNREGLTNGQANGGGWYVPEFHLDDSERTIALIGDTFIQALQIEPQQHLGVQFERQINGAAADEPSTGVLALGHAGYGPGLYLNLEMLEFMRAAYAPEEVIVFLHLGNDLRNLTRQSELDPYYQLDEEGHATVHPDSFNRWHDVAHYVLVAYEQFHPIRLAFSHYMTPMLLDGIMQSAGIGQGSGQGGVQAAETITAVDSTDIPGVRGIITSVGATSRGHTLVRAMDLVETPGMSNFLFEKADNADEEEAHRITNDFIKTAHAHLAQQGIAMRLVTIPAFPPAFYTEFADGAWQPELAEYDLLRPEKRLQEFAAAEGIPFLAMGRYMQESDLTAAEIGALFYKNGTGHFTEQGHAFFADALYDCFYAAEQRIANATSCASE